LYKGEFDFNVIKFGILTLKTTFNTYNLHFNLKIMNRISFARQNTCLLFFTFELDSIVKMDASSPDDEDNLVPSGDDDGQNSSDNLDQANDDLIQRIVDPARTQAVDPARTRVDPARTRR